MTEREYQADYDAEDQARAMQPNKTLARNTALALLKQHKISAPEVDLELLARACRLTVKYIDVDGQLSGQLYPAFCEIVINQKGRSRPRQRFTLAHELGHWRLGHYEAGELPPDTLGFAGAYEDDVGTEGRSRIEIEANTFAAELLMPSPWIRKIQKPLPQGAPSRLAQMYGVSEQAMYYQLLRCGRFA